MGWTVLAIESFPDDADVGVVITECTTDADGAPVKLRRPRSARVGTRATSSSTSQARAA